MRMSTDGVAQNRNIIMHLLSQVRIGMDLSRVCESLITNTGIVHNDDLGHITNIYIRKTFTTRNVCRFFCTPRLICQVSKPLSLISVHAYILYSCCVIVAGYRMPRPLEKE